MLQLTVDVLLLQLRRLHVDVSPTAVVDSVADAFAACSLVWEAEWVVVASKLIVADVHLLPLQQLLADVTMVAIQDVAVFLPIFVGVSEIAVADAVFSVHLALFASTFLTLVC